jgi:hypothetical protein
MSMTILAGFGAGTGLVNTYIRMHYSDLLISQIRILIRSKMSLIPTQEVVKQYKSRVFSICYLVNKMILIRIRSSKSRIRMQTHKAQKHTESRRGAAHNR